jgi:hypothetical protein
LGLPGRRGAGSIAAAGPDVVDGRATARLAAADVGDCAARPVRPRPTSAAIRITAGVSMRGAFDPAGVGRRHHERRAFVRSVEIDHDGVARAAHVMRERPRQRMRTRETCAPSIDRLELHAGDRALRIGKRRPEAVGGAFLSSSTTVNGSGRVAT